MEHTNMAAFGLTGQYAAWAEELRGTHAVGRILSQEKGMYRLVGEDGEQWAEVSGTLRYRAQRASDFPAVGDFVVFDRGETEGHAVIHRILPRKSVFLRKAAGTAHTEQVVAANIDTVFLCMSLNQDFNIRRLERYLSAAWDSGAVPVIVLTKSDLCADLEPYLRAVEQSAVGTELVVTSGVEQDGFEKLLPYVQEGKTVAFLGSSGVGKSTLINRLLGEERLATNGLRNDDKGRHTTTRRELFLLKQGGMVMDTPGMRELGLWESGEGLDQSFADIEGLAERCRFRDCSHQREPGCAVRQAILQGELSEERWRSYQKLKAETRYTEQTEAYLAEKKQKFKQIAKRNKSSRKR